MLDHERLDGYQTSIGFLAVAFGLVETLPRGCSELRDPLPRAATSIPLKIAEGSGKLDGPDRRRDYAIARGSAMECAAILEVIRLLSAAPNPSLDEGKGLLVRVVEMLSRMCR